MMDVESLWNNVDGSLHGDYCTYCSGQTLFDVSHDGKVEFTRDIACGNKAGSR